jgi:predicted FMN-binding regulatory protein PaiB
MSQNRSEADRQGVVDGLAASAAPGAAAVHALMSGDAPGAGGAGTA